MRILELLDTLCKTETGQQQLQAANPGSILKQLIHPPGFARLPLSCGVPQEEDSFAMCPKSQGQLCNRAASVVSSSIFSSSSHFPSCPSS